MINKIYSNMEIWRDIKDFEGYQVSNYGRVRSNGKEVKYSDGRVYVYNKILKPRGDTYLYVNMYVGGKTLRKSVHRLVAKAFLPNPEELPEVNHKDENKKNNNVENLEWCTKEYNLTYGTRLEKFHKPVMAISIEDGHTLFFQSIKEAKEKGFKSPSIVDCCKGRKKTYKNYIWKYLENNDKESS